MAHRKVIAGLLLLFIVAVGSVSASADDVTPEEMWERLFTSETLQSEWFEPEMLAQVPLAQLDAIVEQYIGILGAYEGAEGTAPTFRLSFEHGHVETQLVLSTTGQIAGIWFGPPEPYVDGLDDTVAGFHELPGEVSVLVVSDSGILVDIDSDVPLAVGSAFKLAIVASLQDQVNAGLLSWDDVVRLEAEDISLPTGILQDWPVGAPLTVESLATLMIYISDNTATDALMRLVGRETVEMYAPHNAPLLTTRETFTLKAPANRDLLEAYREAGIDQRRALLDDVADRPLPSPLDFPEGPMALDVEWFFTVGELANLIAYVHELPFMSINPGLATSSDWQHVAFKGGSEPGVLNYTHLVVGNSGTTYVVSATWNNDEHVLDESRFIGLYSRLLAAVKQLDDAN